jgi:4-aminobutyrate aminotransferase-like enzyme
MLSVLEAYHGWTVGADAVSTSIADNPKALSSRPDWVHPVTAPNTYRGEFRGPDSAPDYVRSVEHNLAKIAEQTRQLAGFICEPVYGNAAGLPEAGVCRGPRSGRRVHCRRSTGRLRAHGPFLLGF